MRLDASPVEGSGVVTRAVDSSRPVVEGQVEEDRVFGAIDADVTVHLVPILRLVGLGLEDGLEEVADAERAVVVLLDLGLLHARRAVGHFRT